MKEFRAWDKRNNKWIHPDLFIMTNAAFYTDYRAFEDGCSLFGYEYELMKYTGIKDKHDNRIYEGDILKHVMSVRTGTRRTKVGRSYESYAIKENKEIIGVVKQGFCSVGIHSKNIPCFVVESSMSTNYDSYFWGEGKRTDKPDTINQNLSEPLFNDKEYEVIGNIYDNPELLGL